MSTVFIMNVYCVLYECVHPVFFVIVYCLCSLRMCTDSALYECVLTVLFTNVYCFLYECVLPVLFVSVY